MGSVTKIHRNLDYFERIVGHTIEGVGIYDGAEVCIFENETGLVMQINDLELDS